MAVAQATFPGAYDESLVYVNQYNGSRWSILEQSEGEVVITEVENPANRQSWFHDAFGVYFKPE